MNKKESKVLSAKEFCDLLAKGELPQSFIVNEIVTLRKDVKFLEISGGIFQKEVFIYSGVLNSVKLSKCKFAETIYFQNRKINGHFELKECVVSNISLIDCTINRNIILSKNTISNFSISGSSWTDASIDDYGVARVLSLAKQGIYIDLKNIPKL